MSVIRLILVAPLLIYMLTACSSKSNEDDLEESVPDAEYVSEMDVEEYTASNPCVDKWVIQGMKGSITEYANELIATKHGYSYIDESLIDSADISFSFITSATELENGNIKCSAQADITYKGDSNTYNDVAIRLVRVLSESSRYHPKDIMGMGINSYSINKIKRVRGNSFSVDFDYEIGTTYSEAGDQHKSYTAMIGEASAMLATVASFDQYLQAMDLQNEQEEEAMRVEYERNAAQLEEYTSERNKNASSKNLDNDYYDSDQVIVEEPSPQYNEATDFADEVVVVEEYVEY